MSGIYSDGTGGWSEDGASRDRAVREALDGTFSERLRKIRDLAYEMGVVGITFKDVDEQLGTHHGQSSGALTNLHKQGALYRMTVYRRDRCSVYIHPDHAHRFLPEELMTSPAESKAERLRRELADNQKVIEQLRDEVQMLRRRLNALDSSQWAS